jgi:O-acetyl-ADP-ribose deacetylase (regulator of RNase III)
VKDSDTAAKLQDLSIVLGDITLLADLKRYANISDLIVSSANAMIRDKGGVDAASLANNWGIEIEAAKRTHLVTTQRGIRKMMHPSLTNLYKKNDSQLWYQHLTATNFTDKMYSAIIVLTLVL